MPLGWSGVTSPASETMAPSPSIADVPSAWLISKPINCQHLSSRYDLTCERVTPGRELKLSDVCALAPSEHNIHADTSHVKFRFIFCTFQSYEIEMQQMNAIHRGHSKEGNTISCLKEVRREAKACTDLHRLENRKKLVLEIGAGKMVLLVRNCQRIGKNQGKSNSTNY